MHNNTSNHVVIITYHHRRKSITINKIKLGLIFICAIAPLLYSLSINIALQSNMGRFHPDRTRFIDQVGNNLLYRGNVPIIRVNVPTAHKTFALNEIIASMVSPSGRNSPVNPKATAPDSIPNPYLFVDFSLLNKSGRDRAAWGIEKHFFINRPMDKLIHYELHQLLFKGVIMRDVGRIYDQVITALRQQLETTSKLPRIIFLHCKAGLDRTGTITAGYAMKYLGYSYNEAIGINITQGLSRAPDFYATMAAKNYARYLRDTIGIKTIGEIPD